MPGICAWGCARLVGDVFFTPRDGASGVSNYRLCLVVVSAPDSERRTAEQAENPTAPAQSCPLRSSRGVVGCYEQMGCLSYPVHPPFSHRPCLTLRIKPLLVHLRRKSLVHDSHFGGRIESP